MKNVLSKLFDKEYSRGTKNLQKKKMIPILAVRMCKFQNHNTIFEKNSKFPKTIYQINNTEWLPERILQSLLPTLRWHFHTVACFWWNMSDVRHNSPETLYKFL